MTQLGELVNPGMPFENLDWECPHAHDQEEYDEAEEDLDNPEEDEEAEADNHDLKNSASKLGRSLKANSQPRVDSSTDATKKVEVKGYKPAAGGDDEFKYTVAAHHLIPGNAALKRSTIMQFVTKKDSDAGASMIEENIGYNVNGKDNGIWLVGWYAVRKSKNTPVANKGWGDLGSALPDFRTEYVKAVVRFTIGQFHDTHEPYSDNVLNVLDGLAELLETNAEAHCEECKEILENPDGKLPPPYWLKARMHSFSAFLGGKLRGATTASWQLDRWCTSSTWKDTMATMTSLSS